MMKKFYKIVLVLAFAVPFLPAQNLKEPSDFFNSVFRGANRVNSFYTGGNPAYLHFDATDEMLSVKSVFTNEEGDYKRFIDPGTDRLYELSFTGKKSIDSVSVFKGSFGVQRSERKNWGLIYTKELDKWNPFLLGDSSTGNAYFNGIVMNAQYGAILFDNLLAGFNFNYSVDEGLKEIFPHPTSEHRDINIKFGLGYLLNKDLSVGAFLDIADNYEKIIYTTDQEGINRETFLLKYRGYGAPVLYSKKDETRDAYGNKYAGYFTFQAECGSALSAAAYFGGGIEHLSITDGSGRPVAEGYLKNTFYKGGLNLLYNLSANINAGLYYDFSFNNIWAKHPRYNVLIMENNYPSHIIKAGIDYALNNNIKIGAEAGIDYSKYDYKDYYSNLTWKSEPSIFILSIGADVKLTQMISAELYLGYNKCSANGSSLFFSADSINTKNIDNHKNDFLFYQTNYDHMKISFIPSCSLGSLALVKLYANYSLIKPEKANWPGSVKRENLDAILEFRLNVY